MTEPSPGPAAPPQLITRPDQLARLVDRLRSAPRLGVDTEAASFHRYLDRVYLLQVSSDRETAIIDPLALPDLASFGELLASPDIEVVFHDADYDLRTLDRDYAFRARRVFDTRIAAQLLGEPAIGLGSLLVKYFGVTLDKKYQRADWSLRPLTAPMIAYAADDTRHLPALRDRLAGQLEARGRLAWAEEEFGHLESVRWSGADRDADAYLRLKGARLLRGRSLAVLRSLHAWREATARELDAAPFRVLGNEALIALARAVPLQLSSLPGPPELPAALARRYGAAVIAVIREAAEAPEATWPRLERGPRETQDPAVERRLERLKALRNARARELAIDAGVLCPNGTLQAVAERSPATADQLAAIPELRRWQRIALGESKILETLKDPPAGPP